MVFAATGLRLTRQVDQLNRRFPSVLHACMDAAEQVPEQYNPAVYRAALANFKAFNNAIARGVHDRHVIVADGKGLFNIAPEFVNGRPEFKGMTRKYGNLDLIYLRDADQGTYLHELFHVFDDRLTTTEERERYAYMLGAQARLIA